jgi:hypothetical protein
MKEVMHTNKLSTDTIQSYKTKALATVKKLCKRKLDESAEIVSELGESFTVVDHKGKQVHVAYSEIAAKKKAEELSKSTGNAHTVKFKREATVNELSTGTLDSYAEKAKKSSSALMNKAGRSKNLTRAMELLDKSGKRQDGITKATAKSSYKKAGQRWGVTESEEIVHEVDEATVVHSSKEKDGKEYQVLSRKAGREFVIQSKKSDGTWHTHDSVGSSMRAQQLISTGRYSAMKEGEIASADKKVGADGRLYPAHRMTIGS